MNYFHGRFYRAVSIFIVRERGEGEGQGWGWHWARDWVGVGVEYGKLV